MWIGVLTAIITTILAVTLKIDGASAVILVLAQLILANGIEVLIRIQSLKIFSLLPPSAIQALLSKPSIADTISRMLDCYKEVDRLQHPIIKEELRRVMEDHANDLEQLTAGGYATRPVTRPYFRDLAVIDGVKSEILAVSMSNPRTYWNTVSGRNYLERQAALRKRLKSQRSNANREPIQRVFICASAALSDIIDVLKLHREYCIPAWVAIYEEVPADLCRDFYVLDREFVTYLDLDAHGETLRAGFFVRGGKMEKEVDAALRRFESLRRYCRKPEDIPELASQLA